MDILVDLVIVLVGLALCDANSPKLTWQKCTAAGCSNVAGSLTSDSNWRGTNVHSDADYACFGVETSGSTLKQVLTASCGGWKNVGSRLYLLAESGTAYEMFTFIGKELTYTVDLSQVVCGVNAAFYTVEMPANGASNDAAYGTGYCDGNFVGGNGCAEFDIQEANVNAMVYTTHPCQNLGTVAKGSGECYANGCGFNAYRYDKAFWGTTVDPKKPLTVVTQFVADSSGALAEVRRLYVQDGRQIELPKASVGSGSYDSITDDFCSATGSQTGSWYALAHLGDSFKKGHVLVWALWDSDDMKWLDSGDAGPCTNSGTATSIENAHPDLTVTFSDLKYGDIGTTF